MGRRMFSPQIIDSDAFLDMSVSARELYFQLGMRADDDGFVGNPKKIMRMIGGSDDDMKILISKRFVLIFESGVIVIKHWRINNLIRKDWYKETVYLEEKKSLKIKDNGSYTELVNETTPKSLTQVKIGKDRLSKDKIGKETSELSSQVKQLMDIFYKINPTLNWGNKTTRKASEDLIKKFGLAGTLQMAEQIVAVQGQKFAPVCTTPYQMKEKLAQFKIYFDGLKEKDNKFKVESV